MSAEQTAEVLNGRQDAPRAAELRAEFAGQYVDDLVRPNMGNLLGGSHSGPSDPGRLVEPGQVPNHMSGQVTPLARQINDIENEIHYQNHTLGGTEAGAANIQGQAAIVAGRNAEANANSLANQASGAIDDNTGGGLVNDGDRVGKRLSSIRKPIHEHRISRVVECTKAITVHHLKPGLGQTLLNG